MTKSDPSTNPNSAVLLSRDEMSMSIFQTRSQLQGPCICVIDTTYYTIPTPSLLTRFQFADGGEAIPTRAHSKGTKDVTPLETITLVGPVCTQYHSLYSRIATSQDRVFCNNKTHINIHPLSPPPNQSSPNTTSTASKPRLLEMPAYLETRNSEHNPLSNRMLFG